MSGRTFMIIEAICCLREAKENLQHPEVHLLDQSEAIEQIVNQLKQRLNDRT